MGWTPQVPPGSRSTFPVMRELRSLRSPGSPCLPAIHSTYRIPYRDKSKPVDCSRGDPPIAKLVADVCSRRPPVSHMLLYTLLAEVPLLVPSVFSSFFPVPVCILWPPTCAMVEFLVPASSINWRRRLPAHQDGSHFERAATRPASICRNPSPSLPPKPMLSWHLLSAGISFFYPWIVPLSMGAPHRDQNFCNKAHMSPRCWLVFSYTTPSTGTA